MTLFEFLAERLGEDEISAREVPSGRWPVVADDGLLTDYLTRLDPSRVLAEVEAKRRIVELHEPFIIGDLGETLCYRCGHGNESDPGARWPCLTVAALGTVYADHPDYEESWRP
ncbi:MULTISPECIES: DUF6221 family protein [unclassified Isoptericola]|uniref:DUF6221 family protein n=1 Tax=unclassified Isoptericola TaxID=2623355 RepID=UPI002714479B|nr:MULTISPECIES: DUF6221 family protein [unclassified Isoptericola]MDO8149455.1 DUF6221 family protein [Isoptericola sp. b515]MDO8152402.1 DUF6221 family protein [Isoptericola sp. b408]